MRTISDAARAALDSGQFDTRALVKLMPLGSDPLCIWDDRGKILVGDVLYVGKPGRFTLSASSSSTDFSVRNMDITLSALDPQAIALVESAQWHQRPVLIHRAVMAKETPKVLNISPEFAGFMDTIEWSEVVRGQATLTIHCESSSREYARKGARTASDADQRERDSNDAFLSFAQSSVSTTIKWGTNPQAPPKQTQSKGFFEKLFGL